MTDRGFLFVKNKPILYQVVFSQEVLVTEMCKPAILNDNAFHMISCEELLFSCSHKQSNISDAEH